MAWGSGVEQHEHDVAEVAGAAREHHRHHNIDARLEFVEQVTDKLLSLAQETANSLEKAAARIIELGDENYGLSQQVKLLQGEFSALDQKRTQDARAAFDRIAALEDALAQMPAPDHGAPPFPADGGR